MKVILIKDVDNLGGANELVNVKNGYARNFLIPQRFAVEASHSNLKQMEERAKVAAKKEAAMLSEINAVIAKLSEAPVNLTAKTGTSGRIFGSITSLQLSRAIRDQKGYEINRKHIVMPEEIKELGDYTAKIDFGNGKETEVNFTIAAE
jgi:large subunit ribosomal protein L9